MRAATVEGLTPDGSTLLLRLPPPEEGAEGELVSVPLAEVRRAQRTAPTLPLDGGPSPREVQWRIRHGESAEDIARAYGLPVGDVARYEGPVLAERAYQARRARGVLIDDVSVEEHVLAHLAHVAGETTPVSWDSWQTDPYRWEVVARAGEHAVLLAFDPRALRVDPLDEGARQAFGLVPPPPDALEEVLRPVRRVPRAVPAPVQDAEPEPRPEPVPVVDDEVARGEAPDAPAPAAPPAPAPAAPPAPAPAPAAAAPRPARRGRVQVPLWDEIDAAVSGGRRRPDAP